MTDFTVQNHGSIFLLVPETDAARTWCDENLPDNRMTLGTTRGGPVVVEHRFIADIVSGIQADGLTVA